MARHLILRRPRRSQDLGSVQSAAGWGIALIGLAGAGAGLYLLLKRSESSTATAVTDTVDDMVSKVTNGVRTAFGLRPYTTYLEDTDIWNAVKAGIQSDPGHRDANTYAAVIDQFHVADNPRYAPRVLDGAPRTFCNIFTQDVMRAMGHELVWGNATDLIKWLRANWSATDAANAQSLANGGFPVIVAWLNPAGTSHVAVVRPGMLTSQGVATANAGAVNFNNKPAAYGFDGSRLPYLEYFTAA